MIQKNSQVDKLYINSLNLQRQFSFNEFYCGSLWYNMIQLLIMYFCAILEFVLKITESLEMASLKLKLSVYGHVYLPKAWLVI